MSKTLEEREQRINIEIKKLFDDAVPIKKEMVEITEMAQNEQWNYNKWKDKRSELDKRMSEIQERLNFLYNELFR